MAVSNPPSLSSIKAEFGGPGNLAAYVRGGAYAPDVPANAAIATTSSALRLSQFAGAVSYVPMSASASNVSDFLPVGISSAVIVGSSTCTVSGGNPSKTYSWLKVSGANFSVSGGSTATATFSYTDRIAGTFSAVYRCTVTDGTSTTYTDISVTFTVSSSPQ